MTTTALEVATKGLSTHITYAGEVERIRVGDLSTDPTYQRDLDDRRIQRMARDFRDDEVGVIEVSRRNDGTNIVLDGQHRVYAAVEAKGVDYEVLCHVRLGMSQAEEASLFSRLNKNRKKLSGYDLWKARRVAGDPTVLELDRILAQYDLRAVSNATKDNKGFSALRQLEIVYRIHGSNITRKTLHILTEAYGANEANTWGQLIESVGRILRFYGNQVDNNRMIMKLMETTPQAIRMKAAALRDIQSANARVLITSIIINQYNKNLKRGEKRLADIPASVQWKKPSE